MGVRPKTASFFCLIFFRLSSHIQSQLSSARLIALFGLISSCVLFFVVQNVLLIVKVWSSKLLFY